MPMSCDAARRALCVSGGSRACAGISAPGSGSFVGVATRAGTGSNSIRGAATGGAPCRGRPTRYGCAESSACADLRPVGPLDLDVRIAGAHVLGDRLADAAALVARGHAITAEQLLLALQRQPCDLPAHRQ